MSVTVVIVRHLTQEARIDLDDVYDPAEATRIGFEVADELPAGNWTVLDPETFVTVEQA
jgi:hypothetical protein